MSEQSIATLTASNRPEIIPSIEIAILSIDRSVADEWNPLENIVSIQGCNVWKLSSKLLNKLRT